jgi:Protein of unknown function (DUF2786)
MVTKRVVEDDGARHRVVEKVIRLIALATDPGTSEEERRTAAVAACELIRKHDVISVAKPAVKKKTVYGWHENWTKEYGDKFVATRCGKCLFCKRSYQPFDLIYPTFFGHLHHECLKPWLKVA